MLRRAVCRNAVTYVEPSSSRRSLALHVQTLLATAGSGSPPNAAPTRMASIVSITDSLMGPASCYVATLEADDRASGKGFNVEDHAKGFRAAVRSVIGVAIGVLESWEGGFVGKSAHLVQCR